MTRTRDKRIGRVRQAIEASPVRRGVLREAYEWFTKLGELPDDDDHVANEVVQQALRGGEEKPLDHESMVADRVRKAGLTYQDRKSLGAAAWPPTVRTALFDEALFAHPLIRKLARVAIGVEVAYGGDVESPGFCARHGLPMFGSIAMHISGWPKCLVRPPYEDQAKQLLARFDSVRGRVDQSDERWFDAHAEALVAFYQGGGLPDDDLHLDSLLNSVELDQLGRHKRGEDVAEIMALLAKIARRQDAAWEDALKDLCEMAKAGTLHAVRGERKRDRG